MWCHDIQPNVTVTRGECRVSSWGLVCPLQLSFSYFCFSLVPHWMNQSPKVNRHLVMPECQRDLSRERENLVFRIGTLWLRSETHFYWTHLGGHLWSSQHFPRWSWKDTWHHYRGILSPSRLKKTGESFPL